MGCYLIADDHRPPSSKTYLAALCKSCRVWHMLRLTVMLNLDTSNNIDKQSISLQSFKNAIIHVWILSLRYKSDTADLEMMVRYMTAFPCIWLMSAWQRFLDERLDITRSISLFSLVRGEWNPRKIQHHWDRRLYSRPPVDQPDMPNLLAGKSASG